MTIHIQMLQDIATHARAMADSMQAIVDDCAEQLANGISPLRRVKRSCCFWSMTKAVRRLSTSLPSIPGWRTEIFAGRQANI